MSYSFANQVDTTSIKQARSYFSTLSQNQLDEKLLDAAESGQVRRLELLVQAGANPDAEDKDGYAALQKAVYNNHEDCAEVLLDNGADINVGASRADDKSFQGTALCYAAFKGNLSMVKFLLSKKAKVNLIGHQRGSALFLSSTRGHTAIVELLLSNGANINMLGWHGLTALITATTKRHDRTVELLLSKGANVNVVSEQGSTALTLAVEVGTMRTVELLLESGADTRPRDKWGYTALDIARTHINSSTLKILEEHIAKHPEHHSRR